MTQTYWTTYLLVALVGVVLILASSLAAASTNVIGVLLIVGALVGGMALRFTAFGIGLSLVGGLVIAGLAQLYLPALQLVRWAVPVSYTHLTLPTKA